MNLEAAIPGCVAAFVQVSLGRLAINGASSIVYYLAKQAPGSVAESVDMCMDTRGTSAGSVLKGPLRITIRRLGIHKRCALLRLR